MRGGAGNATQVSKQGGVVGTDGSSNDSAFPARFTEFFNCVGF